jgi:hypothetical protein
MTSTGIEPAVFRLAALYLSQQRYRVLLYNCFAGNVNIHLKMDRTGRNM